MMAKHRDMDPPPFFPFKVANGEVEIDRATPLELLKLEGEIDFGPSGEMVVKATLEDWHLVAMRKGRVTSLRALGFDCGYPLISSHIWLHDKRRQCVLTKNLSVYRLGRPGDRGWPHPRLVEQLVIALRVWGIDCNPKIPTRRDGAFDSDTPRWQPK
jgi:hypothetical protein